MKLGKRYNGLIYATIISTLFILISVWGKSLLDGTVWYLFSSVHRLSFGIIATMVYCKLYDMNIKQVFSFDNWKSALMAGSGFLLYLIYYVVTLGFGIDAIVGITIPLWITHIFLQQITTGFYEEITYRGLILGGYFEQEKKNWKARLLYASFSSVLFGFGHLIGGDLHTVVFTGMIGFAFATIYLKSHNIFIPMLLHFGYDVFANMASSYIEFNNSMIFRSLDSIFDFVVVIMFVISLIILVKEEKR